MKYKFFKTTIVGFMLSISSLAHSTLIEWEYDINQYSSKFTSTFGSNDRFGFGFDGNTDFNDIATSDLQMFYYVIGGTRYEYHNPYEVNGTRSTTSRFTFDGDNLFWNDARTGPILGNDPGSDWTWLRASVDWQSSWVVSGVNTTYRFVDGNTELTAHYTTNQSNRHDVYDAVRTNYITSVPEPSTLAIFALGMMGLASRRFKKQS